MEAWKGASSTFSGYNASTLEDGILGESDFLRVIGNHVSRISRRTETIHS